MLPDDYSSAKGSLFVLQPGTKAVVFDMVGGWWGGEVGLARTAASLCLVPGAPPRRAVLPY